MVILCPSRTIDHTSINTSKVTTLDMYINPIKLTQLPQAMSHDIILLSTNAHHKIIIGEYGILWVCEGYQHKTIENHQFKHNHQSIIRNVFENNHEIEVKP